MKRPFVWATDQLNRGKNSEEWLGEIVEEKEEGQFFVSKRMNLSTKQLPQKPVFRAKKTLNIHHTKANHVEYELAVHSNPKSAQF